MALQKPLPPDPEAVAAVSASVGYRFGDESLLIRALTHTSFANEQSEEIRSNERLEFLGDAVLDLALGHLLMLRFSNYPEGVLSKLRAQAVNETRLAALSRQLGLGGFLLLGKGEEQTGGRDKPSVLADAYEAMIGAIFLDGGYDAAAQVVQTHFDSIVDSLRPGDGRDYKTRLQELTQSRLRRVPTYTLVRESGPDHDKTFEVELSLDGRVLGTGAGKSKKEAEQEAARVAYDELAATDAGEGA